MPGGLPLGLEVCNGLDYGTDTTACQGISLSSGAANTKGAYVQFTSSTTADACWASFITFNQSTSPTVIDVAVGGVGSEQIICNNLPCMQFTDQRTLIPTPVLIPASTAVSARAQTITATSASSIYMLLHDGAFTQMEGAAGIDGIGFVAGSTLGTAFTMGVNGTFGSWAVLTASTSRDYMGLYVHCDQQNGAPTNSRNCCVNIGIGSTGSEKIIISNLIMQFKNNSDVVPFCGPFFIPIKAGTQIQVQGTAQTAIPAGGTGCIVYGIYQ